MRLSVGPECGVLRRDFGIHGVVVAVEGFLFANGGGDGGDYDQSGEVEG